MTEARRNPLPTAGLQYDPSNEAITRRTLEFALDRIETDVSLAKTQSDKEGSLAVR